MGTYLFPSFTIQTIASTRIRNRTSILIAQITPKHFEIDRRLFFLTSDDLIMSLDVFTGVLCCLCCIVMSSDFKKKMNLIFEIHFFETWINLKYEIQKSPWILNQTCCCVVVIFPLHSYNFLRLNFRIEYSVLEY